MKAHLVTILVVDHDNLGADQVRREMLHVHYPNRYIMPDILSVKTAEIGEWSDEHPLNNIDTTKTEVDRLFDTEDARIAEMAQLSVTNIMLDIQPGLEGEGVEIYAKSVADVEDKLSKMGQELEEWQLGIKKLPVFEGVANTKAKNLENLGYVPCGQLFQQRQEDGSFKFAAVSKAGRVLWWNPEEVRKIPTPPPLADITDICYAEGWNQCCDTHFGGLPAQELQVLTITVEKGVAETTPRPMETAPRDGTIIRLLVEFEDLALEDDTSKPIWTIGGNTSANTGEDPDLWQFAGWDWTHDRFTEGVGKPIGWLPMI